MSCARAPRTSEALNARNVFRLVEWGICSDFVASRISCRRRREMPILLAAVVHEKAQSARLKPRLVSWLTLMLLV